MKTSAAGISLIKRFEGLELEAYKDVAGIWTIGYGHVEPVDGVPVHEGMTICEAKADALLAADLAPREAAILKLVTVPLNQNEFDALVSFVFNIGVEGFRKSTARSRLNISDRKGAAQAMTWWVLADLNRDGRTTADERVKGLELRRAAEKKLFLTPAGAR